MKRKASWGEPLTSPEFDGWCETLIVAMATLIVLILQGLWLAR